MEYSHTIMNISLKKYFGFYFIIESNQNLFQYNSEQQKVRKF